MGPAIDQEEAVAVMREKYEVLVPHIAHRTDLDYILGEIGGELNAGHVYIQTSDDWQIERQQGALLGAGGDRAFVDDVAEQPEIGEIEAHPSPFAKEA